MAVWRRKALEQFPELRRDLESEEYGVYLLFGDLLPVVRQAHTSGNDEILKRVYGFAAWCARQKAKDLWNAAGVSFYEHLFDNWDQRHLVVPWLSPQIVKDHWDLWKARLDPSQLAELDGLFANRRERKYLECA